MLSHITTLVSYSQGVYISRILTLFVKYIILKLFGSSKRIYPQQAICEIETDDESRFVVYGSLGGANVLLLCIIRMIGMSHPVHTHFILPGLTESIATRKALLSINENERPFVLSRSTFPGSGVHAAHWLGDNIATAEDMYYSIPGILNFQMFGVPLVGADICGFNGMQVCKNVFHCTVIYVSAWVIAMKP